jgi:sortase A
MEPDRARARRDSTPLGALLALLVGAFVAVVLVAAPPGSTSTVRGPLPRTDTSRGVVEHLLPTRALDRTASAAVAVATSTPAPPAPAPAPAPAAQETLPRPEDVPDPSVRRPIAVIGRVRIPAIGLDTDLRDQITQESIDLGPSHWPGTAAPGGFGNAVVAGHRASHSAPFHDLGELRTGDWIVLVDAAGRPFTYAVTDMFVVDPSAMWITRQAPGRTLTLFTCHPIGSAAQRLVVRATLL